MGAGKKIRFPLGMKDGIEVRDFEEKGISFQNVHFDGKYQRVLDGMEPEEVKKSARQEASGLKYGGYCADSDLSFMLTTEKQREAKGCYEKICVLMENMVDEYSEKL